MHNSVIILKSIDLHFKQVNYVAYALYLNKAVTANKNSEI